MTAALTLRLQSEFRQFANYDKWKSPHAVTLTMKQGLLAANGNSSTFVRLTCQEASQNFGHFMNCMNRQVFGQAFKRYGKRLPVIPVLEGGNGSHLHYHATIECPRDDLELGFKSLIRSTWLKTQWGRREMDIKIDADEGWLGYISKERDKPDYDLSIDWLNYYNPDCRV